MDKGSKISLLALSICILCAIGFLGVNLYKNLRYSTFTLRVVGTHSLESDKTGKFLHPTSSDSGISVFEYLHTTWWANSQPAYRLDGSALQFHAVSTMNGGLTLTPLNRQPAAVVGVEVKDQSGKDVKTLVPGRWYEVRQYGEWIQVEFEWG